MENSKPLQQALDLNTNKFVEACAGAGKTFALSKRYCAIMEDFTRKNLLLPYDRWLGVKNILVITFTRSAAEEMAERIYKDLSTLLKGKEIIELKEQGIELGRYLRSSSTPHKYKQWIRSTFSQNYISTIDSFCSKLLRENAEVMKLDSEFRTEDDTLKSQYFTKTLDEFIQERSKNFDSNMESFLEHITISDTREFFTYLNNNQLFLSHWIEEFGNLDEESIKEQWIKNYTPDYDVKMAVKYLYSIAEFSKCEVKDDSDKGIEFLKNIYNSLKKIDINIENVELRRKLITEVLPSFLTSDKSNYLKKVPGSKKNWVSPDECDKYKELFKKFTEWIGEYVSPEKAQMTPNEIDFRAIPVIRTLLNLYNQFKVELAKKQRLYSYLSFNDVILKTLELLKNHEDIRKKYSKQFLHILVDEFQDTNDPRWEIIKLIAQNESGKLRDKGIFIVGDRKQSIYRFNQADVTVMTRAEKILNRKAINTEEISIRFNDNYRSSRDFIDNVINPIFRNIFPSEDENLKPYQAFFSPTEYASENISEREIADGTDVCCTVRAVTNYDKKNDEYLPALHAAYTAKEFLEWAETNGISDLDKPVIGILLRKFTNIQAYLEVFQKYNIPFEIVGGRSFYQQQEIFDLFHLVSVLINPHDDIALTGLLRSPIFCISDKEIEMLQQRDSRGESVFSFISRTSELRKVANLINSWRKEAKQQSLDELFENIISADLRELGYISEIGGSQRLANIDRFLHILHNFSLDGISLRDIYEIIKYQIENNFNQSQAEKPSKALVQIMTIHKAKGLQFPAVIIPEMNIKIQPDTSIISHGNLIPNRIELGVTLKDETYQRQKTGLLTAIKNQTKAELEAEDKRLFYVAVTRAQYRIAFLAEFDELKWKKNNWWEKYIVKHFNLSETNDEDGWADIACNYSKTDISLLTAEKLKDNLKTEESASAKWINPPSYIWNKRYQEINAHDIMYSVFLEREFRDKVVSEHQAETDRIFGLIFHKVMESNWCDLNQNEDNIKQFIKHEFPLVNINKMLIRLKQHITNIENSGLLGILHDIPEEDKLAEHKIIGWIDNDELFLRVSGAIDLLYYRNNRWYVLDYKTDRDKNNLQKYRLQIQTYQWIIKQLYSIESEGQIFFSNTGELIPIRWEESYFSEILPTEKHPFHFSEYKSSELISNFLEFFQSEFHESKSKQRIKILCPTRVEMYNCITLFSKEKILTPYIQVMTFDQVVEQILINKKKLPPQLAKLITWKLIRRRNLDDLPGMVTQITDALLKNVEFDIGISERFIGLAEEFKNIISHAELVTHNNLVHFIRKEKPFENDIIILSGFYKNSPKDFEIAKALSKTTKKFYFIDNFKNDDVKQNFPYEQLEWYKVSDKDLTQAEQVCEICFSTEEEVERVAKRILAIENWESKINSVKIAVSSMEVYTPIIKRIFSRYGLPVRFAKKPSIIIKPLAKWILSFAKIMDPTTRVEWRLVADLFLHPIMKPDGKLFDLDKLLRKNGIQYFDQIENYIINLRAKSQGNSEKRTTLENLSKSYNQISKIIKDDIILQNIHTLRDISNKILFFLNKYKINKQFEENTRTFKIYTKICQILGQIPELFEEADFVENVGIVEFSLTLKELFEQTEAPFEEEDYGFEVLGYLDIVNIKPEKLFILGLNEGQFPIPIQSNPYLEKSIFNPWFMNLLMYKRWRKLGNRVVYFSSKRDKLGGAQQPSTFLEWINVKNREDFELLNFTRETKREFFEKSYYNRKIEFSNYKIPSDVESYLQRHNEYLLKFDASNFNEIYRGKTNPRRNSKLIISHTEMDDLLKCPMRYWFSNILKVEPLEFDAEGEERRKLGNVIHEALDRFGKDSGFELAKANLQEACKLLARKLELTLDRYEIKPDEDLISKERYKPYRNDLESGSELNLLVKLLRWNRDNLTDYVAEEFEKEFGVDLNQNFSSGQEIMIGDNEVTLSFRGRIDKIMKRDSANSILATDYKTGKVDEKDIWEFWSSQFLIYYIALKEFYPDKRILLAYEQIKSLKESEHGTTLLMGDINEKIDTKISSKYIKINESENERHLSLNKVKNVFFNFGKKVVKGEFHITSRELNGKACKYCQFSRICRKDSVFLTTNSHSAF
jgi:ATP-dependent exoDNAse (exonuclease V) beta subunit